MVKSRLVHVPPHPRPRRQDQGAVLVLWVLSLATLMGCLAMTVRLGNLQQQAVNVQDAADSAALAGAATLAPNVGTLVQQFISIPGQICRVTTLNQWEHCKNFSWLDGHYLYDPQAPAGAYCYATLCDGWWQIVATVQGPGEIADTQAFQDATSRNLWTCAYGDVIKRKDHYLSYCGALNTGITDPTVAWDVSGTVPGNPASPYNPANAAIVATNNALAITANYNLHPAWSSCSSSLPSQLSLAEGWDGTTCLAYELTAPGPHQNVIFWARLDVNGLLRTAWAAGLPPRLCSGPPQAGNCD